MADYQGPYTIQELRLACRDWPQAVVRRAVGVAVPEPDAALVAAWLTDPGPSPAPPLAPEAVVAVWRQLRASRH